MKVALVHDWLNQLGGAEDVLAELVALFPGAPIFTSLYWRKKMPPAWQNWDIRPSIIDKLPWSRQRQQLYLPLYPLAFENMDLRGYDLVISNKSGFCHGVVTDPETVHICYCLTPTRFLWRYPQYAEQESINRLARWLLPPFLSYLRLWDRSAADRVDHFIAISKEVRRRIAKVYGRRSDIIYPPVDTTRFRPATHIGDYYLMLGRLVPYRRIDLLIEAFNRLGRPLVIAGQGRDRARLEAMAGHKVTFMGYVPDERLPELLAGARAFMFPGEEDFGIAPIQAMAAGRPVIAYAAGGALETVVPGTGTLFEAQSVEAIVEAVESYDPCTADSDFIRSHAMQFDASVFRHKISAFVERCLAASSGGTTMTDSGQPAAGS